jgi:hypothetical protein
MKASEFFKKGQLYKYIGDNCHYFTKGRLYKSYGIKLDPPFEYNILQTNKLINLYEDKSANGLGDSWFDKDIRYYFKEVSERKSHLPEWW